MALALGVLVIDPVVHWPVVGVTALYLGWHYVKFSGAPKPAAATDPDRA